MAAAVPAPVAKKMGQGAIVSFAAWIGFVMIYFDSAIYVVAAPFIAPFFFPKGNYVVEVMLFLLTYPIGYLGRPIGGAIWGHWGDKTGRRVPWLISVAGMGVATVLIGILPTFQQVAYVATGLLIVLRLCQGIFLGGENTGSVVISMEAVPDKLRGMFQGLVRSGFPFGIVLASADLELAHILYPGAALAAGGWRFLFLFGAIPLIVAIASRFFVHESPEWEAKVKPKGEKKSPLKILYRKHWKIVVPVWFLTFGYDLVAQNSASYLPTFMKVFTPATITTIALVGIIPNLIRGVWGPIVGYISDVIKNRKWLLYFQAIALAITAYPLFSLLKSGELYSALLGASLVQIIFMISIALAYLYQSELVPTEVRWALNGSAELGTTFSAFGPFIATFVAVSMHNPLLALSLTIIIGSLIEVVALFVLPKDRAGLPLL